MGPPMSAVPAPRSDRVSGRDMHDPAPLCEPAVAAQSLLTLVPDRLRVGGLYGQARGERGATVAVGKVSPGRRAGASSGAWAAGRAGPGRVRMKKVMPRGLPSSKTSSRGPTATTCQASTPFASAPRLIIIVEHGGKLNEQFAKRGPLGLLGRGRHRAVRTRHRFLLVASTAQRSQRPAMAAHPII